MHQFPAGESNSTKSKHLHANERATHILHTAPAVLCLYSDSIHSVKPQPI